MILADQPDPWALGVCLAAECLEAVNTGDA
jgi:hypothetical protein